jgi:peptide-methionine (S)-S-oxide reductase
LFINLLYLINKKNRLLKKAFFAGGCFWCTESIFRNAKGVLDVVPGYMGGHVKRPAYREVCNGNTGHTETIQITYDSALVTYVTLLEIFFHTHDPTTLNRQGNDVGTQYRSAVFYNNLDEKKEIEQIVESLTKEAVFENPIVTEILPECPFYEAESEHRDYYRRNTEHPYCQYVITPKLKKFKSLFNQLIESNE